MVSGSQRKYIRFSFFTALKKSGIKEFRFHDLRHTFASHLVVNGVDFNTVRELLGQKSLKMTLRYSYLSPNHKKHAVDVLSNRMVAIWSPQQNEQIVKDERFVVTHYDLKTYQFRRGG